MIAKARLYIIILAIMAVSACNSCSGGGGASGPTDGRTDTALSLYRLGTDLSRQGQLGKAAVAFTQGLEMARDEGRYIEEGLCAGGLYRLYGQLFDGTGQVRYAEEAYEALRKSGAVDLMNRAQYNLASAYNNVGRYDKSIAVAKEVVSKAGERGDTVLMAEAMRLMGLSKFASGNNHGAVDSYLTARVLDSTVLRVVDRANLLAAVSADGIGEKLRESVGRIATAGDEELPFELLAARGRYEEAYRGLEKYKSEQDSILSRLLRNNISDSLSAYREGKERLQRERLTQERLLWGVVVFVLLIIGLSVVHLLRRNLREKDRQREAIVRDAECLRADLRSQTETNGMISDSVKELFRQKYAVVDALCSTYYESKGVRLEQKRIVAELEAIMRDLSDGRSDLAAYADRYTDGLYTAFCRDFPALKSDDRRLFLYMMIGFSARSIALLLNEKIEVVYNRKSRLKARIRGSHVGRRDEYLACCG